MPYQWVDPEIVLVHKNVTIYNIYEDDMEDGCISETRYGYDRICGESENSFNIERLPNYNRSCTHEEILREAIDLGYITDEGLHITGHEED